MGGEDVIAPGSMRLYIEAPESASKDKDVDEVVVDKSMPKGPIPDTDILSDHNVKNDAVMYVAFAKDAIWEKIDIVKP